MCITHMVIEIESFRYLQKIFFSLHQTMMAGDNERLRINKILVKLTKCQERLIEIFKKYFYLKQQLILISFDLLIFNDIKITF
jgi:hypothetical protein